MTWIHFREPKVKVVRHHAVIAEGSGGYWTYCGRFQRYRGVEDVTESPRFRCSCCRRRMARPYLIDEETARIAAMLAASLA
jgi:hypothetical protein